MNVPGVMAMLVAPVDVQLRVLLAPELMPVGFAANALIVGTEPLVDEPFDVAPQLTSPRQVIAIAPSRQACEKAKLKMADLQLRLLPESLISMNNLMANNSVYFSLFTAGILDGCSPVDQARKVNGPDVCEIRRSTSGRIDRNILAG